MLGVGWPRPSILETHLCECGWWKLLKSLSMWTNYSLSSSAMIPSADRDVSFLCALAFWKCHRPPKHMYMVKWIFKNVPFNFMSNNGHSFVYRIKSRVGHQICVRSRVGSIFGTLLLSSLTMLLSIRSQSSDDVCFAWCFLTSSNLFSLLCITH